jgi:hypothetical protein
VVAVGRKRRGREGEERRINVRDEIWRGRKARSARAKSRTWGSKKDSVKCGIGLQGSQTEVKVRSKT